MSTLKPLTALAAAAGLALAATPALAASDAAERAGRGVAGMLAPIFEIPGNVIQTTRQEGAAAGWTVGLARGIGMSIVRPPVGFFELVTAPFPKLRDDPPLLEPEYPWSYFEPRSSSVARR